MKKIMEFDVFVQQMNENSINEDWRSNIAKGLAGAALVGSMMGTPVKGQNLNKKPTETEQTLSTFKDLSYDAYLKKGKLGVETYSQWVLKNITISGHDNVKNIDSTLLSKDKVFLTEANYNPNMSNTFTNIRDRIKKKNGSYVENPVVILSKNLLPPGDYLIKGKEQILAGLGLQAAAIGIYLIPIKTKIDQTDDLESISKKVKYVQNVTKIKNISALLIGLAGTGLEISGIINIGKAGLSLNANGIGFKVPIGK